MAIKPPLRKVSPKKTKKGKGAPPPPVKKKKKKLPIPEIVTGIIILLIIVSGTKGAVTMWMDTANIEDSTEQLYYDLQWAKQNAIKHNQLVFVVFDTRFNEYFIYLDKNKNGKEDSNEMIRNTKLLEGVVFATNHSLGIKNIWNSGPISKNPISLDPGQNTLTFTGQGATNTHAAIYLIRQVDLGERNDYARAVRINRSSGEINTLRFFPEDESWG